LASLQAGSSTGRSGLLPLINKLMSLAVLLTLLSAGWVALSFLRSELARRPSVLGTEAKPAEQIAVPAPTAEPGAGSETASKASILVYSASSDDIYYHNSSHLPARARRTALSEAAARGRGLKPCPVCLLH